MKTTVKAKMLTSVLPTEKPLVVSFCTFFRYLGNRDELEKSKPPKFSLKWRHNYFFEVRFRHNQLEKPQFGQITEL